MLFKYLQHFFREKQQLLWLPLQAPSFEGSHYIKVLRKKMRAAINWIK